MSFVIQCLLALVVGYFALYVLLEALSVRKAGKPGVVPCVSASSFLPLADDQLPTVSVLLPICNEKMVVERLIDAVAALSYPRDKIDIFVLDDSSDETRSLAKACVDKHRKHGIPLHYACRETTHGYKAGNLNFGLTLAAGEFIAIFDADCLPPPDFLRKTMPYFQDKEVGFLQTGMAYHNRDASFLTRFQAAEAGHKDNVTTGLASSGFMASLTGSSCVWRRACIGAIGGVSADTITEDVDMGYRAQLHAWKYMFLRDVVSLAELPESMAAFRVQRQRWARGLIHNAVRHVRQVFAVPMSGARRMHALSFMFSSLLLASLYVLLVLALPLAFMTASLGVFFHLCCVLFLLTAVLWFLCNTKGQGTAEEKDMPAWKRGAQHVGYVVMFFPLSLYYFSAAVQVLAGIAGPFHRTPKGCGGAKQIHPPLNTSLIYLEVLSCAYALAAVGSALVSQNYWVVLYAGLATMGFGVALFFTWRDSVLARSVTADHVLITGATGALGSALALEYAAPGVHLTLHGRRAEALEAVAAQCRVKGAQVCTKILDLRQRHAVRQWMKELCREHPLDLLIANAGCNTSIGPDAAGEPFDEVEKLVEVNVLATLALVDGALPAMRKRGSGQIAIISSLAAYYGLPSTPTYCATKAALRIYGSALRGWLHKEGIRVSVVLPGYVASPMCAAMPGPKPFVWHADRAAHTIRRGLARNWGRISFPFPLNLGIWGLSLLPPCLAMPIVRLLGYGR